ncbi:hypothetical protein [Streptomyces sp. NBC_01446]|uniref:hypothetical protein n=1 Tax=Streptomyces sp. NBC_01446 TaxID=2903870 RepID=UPI00224F5BCE|nr:hypothetical protein [Streptomyces sp. NBC_01446]MCX4641536.1 hypothetical protein [Streptomyces sp. NBC_01446]
MSEKVALLTPLLPLAIEVRIARRFAATLADTTLTPLVAAFLRLLRDVAANPPLGGRRLVSFGV